MSGGSYQYLYAMELDRLLQTSEVEDMAERLEGLDYAQDAAAETRAFVNLIREFRMRIETERDRLAGVWKAVEWWDSSDWGEDDLKEALEEYRKEKRRLKFLPPALPGQDSWVISGLGKFDLEGNKLEE